MNRSVFATNPRVKLLREEERKKTRAQVAVRLIPFRAVRTSPAAEVSELLKIYESQYKIKRARAGTRKTTEKIESDIRRVPSHRENRIKTQLANGLKCQRDGKGGGENGRNFGPR